jgi:hypothetical protein
MCRSDSSGILSNACAIEVPDAFVPSIWGAANVDDIHPTLLPD